MERSEELRDFALLYCQAVTSGDMGFLERHLSRRDGLVLIGTGSQEWRTGDAAAVQAYAAQTWGNARGVHLVAGDPQAYREGSVGWVADLAKIRLLDATEIPCGLTMVWHQDEGQWKIVQLHLSVGVECADRDPHPSRYDKNRALRTADDILKLKGARQCLASIQPHKETLNDHRS